MIHSGSQAINAHHLGRAMSANTGLSCLDAESEAGQNYLADLDWACRYADASRRQMVKTSSSLVTHLFGQSLSVIATGGIAALNHRLMAATPPGSKLWLSALMSVWGPYRPVGRRAFLCPRVDGRIRPHRSQRQGFLIHLA